MENQMKSCITRRPDLGRVGQAKYTAGKGYFADLNKERTRREDKEGDWGGSR